MPTAPLAFSIPDTSGNAIYEVLDSTTRQGYCALKDAGDGRWYFRGVIPDDYASGGTFKVAWHSANTTASREARLDVEYASVADTEDIDPTLTAVGAADHTDSTTAHAINVDSWTPGGTPFAAEDVIVGAVFRDGDHANDDLTENVRIAALWFDYTA